MEYTPHTDDSRQELLRLIGVGSFDDLIAGVPMEARQKAPLRLPEGLSEAEVDSLLFQLQLQRQLQEKR